MILTQETLKSILEYDPETGAFRINDGRTDRPMSSLGYRRVRFGGCSYYAHRLAWLYVHGEWPIGIIDHIDGNRENNAISNLRLATRALNTLNRKRSKHNKVGYKGVSARNKKFRARICRDGKVTDLGLFDKPEEAHAAYVAAAERLFGEFARAA